MNALSRREVLRTSAALAATAALPDGLLAAASAAADRPNVLLILTDDQGYGDLSCHGNPVLKTPNLDRLHGQSIRLTDFHVAPMCSPTRGQLMTGMDCLRNGAMATCLGRHMPRLGIPTIAEAFAAGGYRTGIFGKWHLGDTYPYRPMDRGFQEAASFNGFGLVCADEYWCNDYFDPWYLHNGQRKRGSGYCTDFWFDRAMAWMDDRRRAREPFFAYLPTNAPHFPHWVEKKYREPYEGRGPAGFYGMLANLDENIGRLDDFLARTGLRDNTILLFLSDNGYAGDGPNPYNAGLRGGKCAYYEGGHRVPCFIRWPGGGLSRPGDIETPAQVQDVLPTLLDLCRLPTPREAHFDGTSLAGLLRGEKLADRKFVVQYFQNSVKAWDAAVVWNQWRLVRGRELYDVRADRGQQHNVADLHPDVVTAMRGHYEKWWASVEGEVDKFSPVLIGAAKATDTVLTCCEWQDVRADGAESVRVAVKLPPKGGPWNVRVERDGVYEFELRRWPKESDLAISAAAPAFQGRVGTIVEGKAFLIASARLAVDGTEQSQAARPDDKAVTFRLKLKAGPAKIHGWFCDAQGKEVCGAFFAYVHSPAAAG